MSEREDLTFSTANRLTVRAEPECTCGGDGIVGDRHQLTCAIVVAHMAAEGITEEDIYETRQNGAGLGD